MWWSGEVTGADLRRAHARRQAHRRRSARSRLRPARDRARVGVAHASDPRASHEHAIGLKSLSGRDRAAQPGAQLPRHRRVARGSRGSRRVSGVRVRRGRLRGRRGPGRAAGLRRAGDRAVPALPRAGNALGAGRGRPAGDAGGAREPVRVRRTRAAQAGASRCRTGTTLREVSASARDAVRRQGRSRRARSSGRRGSSRVRCSTGSAFRSTAMGAWSSIGRCACVSRDAGGALRGTPDVGTVWAIGDCAAVPDAYRPGRPCPPTAQHAIRQGRLVARNVAATLAGGRVRPFRYRTKGVVAELGHNKAVAMTLGIRWRGFPAWFIARTYHLLLMPGLGRQTAPARRLERRARVRPGRRPRPDVSAARPRSSPD